MTFGDHCDIIKPKILLPNGVIGGKDKMKRTVCKFIVLFVVSVMLILPLFGCRSAEDAASDAFSEMMHTLQSGDINEISRYFDIYGTEKFGFVNAANSDELLEKVCGVLKQLKYDRFTVEKQDDSTCNVSVKVTSADMSAVMDSYIDKVTALVNSPEYQAKISSMSVTEYQTLLAEQMIEVLSRDDLPMRENELKLTMIKQNGEWIPGSDKDLFLNSLFGNFLNATSSLM